MTRLSVVSAVEAKPADVLAAAVEEFERLSGEVQSWRAKWDDAMAEHARLDRELPAALADDPDLAEQMLVQLRAAQDRAAAAERVIPVVEERQVAAGRAVVAAEAVLRRVVVERKRSALDRHEAKAAELLEALETFTGARYRVRDLAQEARDAGKGFVSVPLAKGRRLRAELEEVERELGMLEVAAAGGSVREAFPGVSAEDLPAVLHPVTGSVAQVDFVGSAEERAERARVAREAAAERSAAAGVLADLLANFPGVEGDLLPEGEYSLKWQGPIVRLRGALRDGGQFDLPDEDTWRTVERVAELAGFEVGVAAGQAVRVPVVSGPRWAPLAGVTGG